MVRFDIAKAQPVDYCEGEPLGIELWRLLVAEVLHETTMQPWCSGTRRWLRWSYVLLKMNQCRSMGAASAINPIPDTFLMQMRAQNPD